MPTIHVNTTGPSNSSAPASAAARGHAPSAGKAHAPATGSNASATGKAPAAAPSGGSTLDLLGSGADLAFVIYALQIQQLDGIVRQSLDEVQQIQKLRTALNDRLTELREWKAHIAQYGQGDGDAKKVSMLDWGDDETKAQWAQKDFALGKDGSVVPKEGAALGKATTALVEDADGVWRTHKYHEVSMADVEKEINRVQGIAQALDGDREIKMIMMNSQLNKKEQAVTQLTNFIKKASDTQSAIVNNLR